MRLLTVGYLAQQMTVGRLGQTSASVVSGNAASTIAIPRYYLSVGTREAVLGEDFRIGAR